MSLHTVRMPLPRLVVRGQNNTFRIRVLHDGQLDQVVSGTYSLYDGDGNLVWSGAVTTPGNEAQVTVPGAATTGKEFSTEWREEWALVCSHTEPVSFRFDAYLVRRELPNVVADDDLLQRHSDLLQMLPVGVTTCFEYIESAWVDEVARLIADGTYPHKIVQPWALRRVIVASTLATLFRDFSTRLEGTDKFSELAAYYAQEASQARDELQFKVDEKEDGSTSTYAQPARPVVFLSSSPRMGWRGLTE